jgi:hypothetical protein
MNKFLSKFFPSGAGDGLKAAEATASQLWPDFLINIV